MTEAEEINLGELLAALTVEVRGLSTQFRRSRAGRFAQWLLSAGLVAAIVVSGYAIAGNRQVANCLNTNLGARSAPSLELTKAQRTYALAQLAYAQAQSEATHAQNASSGALFILLKAPADEQAADYQKFLSAFAEGQMVAARTETALDAFVVASGAYVAANAEVQTAQNSHPLGKC